MKKVGAIIMFLFILVTSYNCGNNTQSNSQNLSNSSDTGKAVITFNEYEHHFGKVVEGEKVGYVFTFKNTGTSNLIIHSASTSCGCTVPRYNNKPVLPGESGELEVVFDTSGRSGMQTKTISVNSNASKPVMILKITADIINN